jgi:hypothetical protein
VIGLGSRLVRGLGLVAGAVGVIAVAVWLAVVEVFWLPLRVGGVLVPVSVVAAVVGNLLLTWLAFRLTGSRLVAALPALTWGGVVLAAMGRRPEGDLIISGGGGLGVVGLAFLLLGVTAAALAVGGVLGSASRRRPVAAPGPPAGRWRRRRAWAGR